MAALLSDYSDAEELTGFRGNFYECEKNGTLTPQVQFEYAVVLIRSAKRAEIKEGITLMQKLYDDKIGDDTEFYLLYLAAAYGKIDKYRKALVYIKKFLASHPDNKQGKELEERLISGLFDSDLKKLGKIAAGLLVGSLIGGGVGIIAAIGISVYRHM